jgi:conjugative relaxase-like TrwC/TraI family protein
MSIRKVSAGHGYAYVLKSVVNADGDRTAPDQVTRYYLEAGTPPGFWLGEGVAYLGDGELAPGQTVTATQLKRLIGSGRDPVSGDPLGRDFQLYKSVAERIESRVTKLDSNLVDDERRTATARITAEETKAGDRHAVAGFDLTFSVPKSVSVLWAVADANTQALIVEAHHAAVAETLALLEKRVAATRTGHGGMEQKAVVGTAAAAYDHWDSRANDPQLHTHVVVSNKVKTADDGTWRALDAKPLFDATFALSAHYDATLRDRLTGTFGLAWEKRDRPSGKLSQWELEAVPDTLISEFSSRTHQIDACTEELVDDHVARHGRTPSARTRVGASPRAGQFTPVHDASWAAACKAPGDAAGTRALIEVLKLHRDLRHDQVVTGLPPRWTLERSLLAQSRWKRANTTKCLAARGTEPRAEPTEPPGRQTVRSLTERRLRAQLPADDRPLPTVDRYDYLRRVCLRRLLPPDPWGSAPVPELARRPASTRYTSPDGERHPRTFSDKMAAEALSELS